MTLVKHPFFSTALDLDQWVQDIVRWHFDANTGSPYWLRRREGLGFDPIAEIKAFADLQKFGLFDDNDLKSVPAQDFIPQAHRRDGGPFGVRVYETGGTLGTPKRVIDHSYREVLASWFSYSLDQCGFPQGGNWLHCAPAGPHAVGYTTQRIAHRRGGLAYYVDLDPRWIKRCILGGQSSVVEQYIEHVLEQTFDVMKSQKVSFLFTTPPLLQRMCERVKLDEMGIRGIVCGGTHVTPDMHMLIRQEMAPGIPLCIVYGNTIMGVAPQYPYAASDGWDVRYYGLLPYFSIKLV